MLAAVVIWLNRIYLFLAGVVLMGLMLLACANMLLRFFGHPLQGTFEILGLGGAFVAASALGSTQLNKGHIQVDILPALPGVAGKAVQLLGRLACVLFFALLSWQLLKLGGQLAVSGELSETLRLAYYPVVLAVGLGFVLLVLVLLLQLVQELSKGQEP
ncbi:MAG: TRAP transporter small permease subunit [Desulfohalobiaceae bacterium]